MPVKIRLMRIGAKKRPFFRVVAVDGQKKRTGAYLELLGTYNPLTEPKEVILKQDRIDHWLKLGAQPSDGYLRITGKAPQRPPRKPKRGEKAAAPAEAAPKGAEGGKPAEAATEGETAPEAETAPATDAPVVSEKSIAEGPPAESAKEAAEALAEEGPADDEGAAEETTTKSPNEDEKKEEAV